MRRCQLSDWGTEEHSSSSVLRQRRQAVRQLPRSDAALRFIGEWKAHAGPTDRDALVFWTRTGNAISPNNVLRRAIFPACDALQLRHATWLIFRRTYSSRPHHNGVPGKVIAQVMGHAIRTPW